MLSYEILRANLLSPVVLAFFLGAFAAILKSDLKFPEAFFSGLSAYLLLAIGFKGGVALGQTPLESILTPIGATLGISLVIPFIAFFCCRFMGGFNRDNSAAMAAHYGSVSIVTFITTRVFVESIGLKSDDFMTGLVAIMEVPGIVVALLLAQGIHLKNKDGVSLFEELKVIFLSKSIYLLWGGLLMGVISGPEGFKKVSAFFVDPFYGILVLFMLEMGILAGERVHELKNTGAYILGFAIGMPLLSAMLGIVVAKACGFSIANALVFATMTASASYIAAPAAVRLALPKANPAYYLTSSLAITFPFNLTIGIPTYYLLAQWWYKL